MAVISETLFRLLLKRLEEDASDDIIFERVADSMNDFDTFTSLMVCKSHAKILADRVRAKGQNLTHNDLYQIVTQFLAEDL